MLKNQINKSWVLFMILRDLQFGGQANFVHVKDNARLVHVTGALGMSREKSKKAGDVAWDQWLEGLNARLRRLNFIYYRWRVTEEECHPGFVPCETATNRPGKGQRRGLKEKRKCSSKKTYSSESGKKEMNFSSV